MFKININIPIPRWRRERSRR